MTILVTGLLFIVPLVQYHSQSLRTLRENRGESNNHLQVASPSFMLLLSTDGKLCTESEHHSTSWLLCTRDVKLAVTFLVLYIASLKLLFLPCRAERWRKNNGDTVLVIKANQTNAGLRTVPYSVKPF